MVARLHSVKSIVDIVNAFADVADRVEGAQLEIWGDGEEKEKIIKAIADAKSNHEGVTERTYRMMGYANNAMKVFRSASVSLAMSKFEGFGVSFAESIGCGTPVVSYRTNYGPEDIISDGETGFLVDSRSEFVDRVSEILSGGRLSGGIDDIGQSSIEKYSLDRVAAEWIRLFKPLEEKIDSKTMPKKL